MRQQHDSIFLMSTSLIQSPKCLHLKRRLVLQDNATITHRQKIAHRTTIKRKVEPQINSRSTHRYYISTHRSRCSFRKHPRMLKGRISTSIVHLENRIAFRECGQHSCIGRGCNIRILLPFCRVHGHLPLRKGQARRHGGQNQHQSFHNIWF